MTDEDRARQMLAIILHDGLLYTWAELLQSVDTDVRHTAALEWWIAVNGVEQRV